MKTLSSLKPLPAIATALISISLIPFATNVSAQAPGGPGGPGARGHQMDGAAMQGEKGERRKSRKAARKAQHMARLYDTNGDGQVSLIEINADQARMFTALDVDGDNSMSVDEIKRRGRSLEIFRTTTLFDLLDSNGDGKLSVAEVQAPSKRWFKRYDKNANGIMEAEELPQGHKRGGRHGKRRGGHR